MKMFKIVFLAVLLAMASCRTVPFDVMQAHATSRVEATLAFNQAKAILNRVESRSLDLNDELVTSHYREWQDILSIVFTKRDTVETYLRETKADASLIESYLVAEQLLVDMDYNFGVMAQVWSQMIEEENADRAAEFIRLFRRDIERYKELQRKFNEWITQFRVSK